VAPEFVLTAAHCFDGNLNGVIEPAENSANELWASLNRTRISDTSKGQVIRGQAVFLNPANDIALLRLASASSAPIVQLDPSLPANNTNLTTAGWGAFTTGGAFPDNMQRGSFRVVMPSGLDLLYVNNNTEEMCGGDSGGPVFTEFSGLARVVAAHTNSPVGCGVNTGNARGSRVDSAIAWIRSIIDTNGFDRRAFVWANQPGVASYAPSASYSFNSLGLPNTVTRSGVGVYRVLLGGMAGANGNVQVTAYGAVNDHCKVASWVPSGGAMAVNVRCFNRSNGVPADNRFNVVFIHAGNSRQPGSELGYVWANNATSPSYVPSTLYQFNSSRVQNTIQRVAVGTYNVILPGLSGTAGTVHVTAYGTGSQICNVGFWIPSGARTLARVHCYAVGGAPTDTQFSLAYVRDMSLASNPNERGAYVWSYNQSASYTTSSAYQFNTKTSANVSVTRLGTGAYSLRLLSMPGSNKTMAMATAYGSDKNCTVVNWLPFSLPFPFFITATDVRVNCYAPNGVLADSQFTLSYSTNVPN
jgi:hypothetical protein